MSNIEITTDAQAEAARKKLDALKEWDYAFQKECEHPEIDIISAALAAYEERKAVKDIVLSEDELAYIVWMCAKSGEPAVRASLSSKGLKSCYDYRAYLAQKPKLTNGCDVEWTMKGTLRRGVYVGKVPLCEKHSLVIPLGHGWATMVVLTDDLTVREVR